jgi:hypothetical protein
MDNLKYVRIDNIHQRLTQRIKGKEIPFEDIVEWCAECELVEIGHFNDWFLYLDIELTLVDQEVDLPANCWYIKAIKTTANSASRHVDFVVNGNAIIIDEDLSTVYIDYYAFPTDSDTGYLLIPRGHENACFWYCMKALHLSDYLDGRLDQNRWNMIENEYQMACEKATALSSRISDNERAKVLDAMRTTIYNYKNLTRR